MHIHIGDTVIGSGHSTFLIAEVGINHNGDIEKAKKLLMSAKEAGADAVKIQTYVTEKRVAKDSPIFTILKACELSYDEQATLFSFAKERNILLFSTPFDAESVEFLSTMHVACYKIASFDAVNEPLLSAVAEQGMPVILSRGMANQKEIDRATDIFNQHGTPFALLHCISAYPIPAVSDLHLSTIRAMQSRYKCVTGYSDHTIRVDIPAIAVAAGATIIEKHFMLEQDMNAPDAPVSLEPHAFSEMARHVRETELMLGDIQWESIDAEYAIRQFRRVQQL